MYKVIISVINHNQKKLLDRCLHYLGKMQIPYDWHIVVLDNKSTDGSADMVEKKYPWVEQIRHSENADYGRGHNIVYARTDSHFFIVLNPDVIVKPGDMEELVRVLDTNSDVAITGPCLLNPDGSMQYSARRDYNWRTVFSRRLLLPGRRKVNDYHLMKDCYQKDIYSVNWILGALICVRREAFPRKELFDPRYKKYFEDVDLCYFARRDGWKVLYCPHIKMIHDHQRVSASSICNRATLSHFASWLKFWWKSNVEYR